MYRPKQGSCKLNRDHQKYTVATSTDLPLIKQLKDDSMKHIQT